MTLESDHSTEGYPIPAEDMREINRLRTQGQLLNRITEGAFHDLRSELPYQCQVLDVGCGPGDWVRAVATAWPDSHVTGGDINRLVLQWAQTKAKEERITNVCFLWMDATKAWNFPDASFDLVNARTIFGFLQPHQWNSLLKESKRVLRPAGIFRIIEAEWGVFAGEAEAVERLSMLFNSAWREAGRSFSPTGLNLATTAILEHLVQQAGFEKIKTQTFSVNYSSGQFAHEAMTQDYLYLFALLREFVVKWANVSEEEYDRLYEQAKQEMNGPNFFARSYLLQVTARKEGKEDS